MLPQKVLIRYKILWTTLILNNCGKKIELVSRVPAFKRLLARIWLQKKNILFFHITVIEKEFFYTFIMTKELQNIKSYLRNRSDGRQFH